MKKSRIILVGVVLAAAAVTGGLYYYKQNNAVVDLSELYQVHTVYRDNVDEKVSGSGKVEIKDKVSIYLNASQIVSKVHVKEGDRVKAGDILVEYDLQQDYSDLLRKLNEAEIQMQNAQLTLQSIAQSAGGNELVQYNSDVTTALKNIADAEEDLITAEKNIADSESELNSIIIRISQQQLLLDDAKATLDNSEILFENGLLASKSYDDAKLAYNSAVETMNDLLIQKETKEKTLETRKTQLEYAVERRETRKTQAEYAQQKLENSQNKLSDESNQIQYNIQQNIISLNQISIEQIKADMDKLIQQSASPINGNITSINASEGGTISKGTPVITISDTSSIIAKLDISEYDAPSIELGQKVYITTSALPDKVYSGTIVKIAEEAIEKEDSSNNEVVVPIEISIDNIDEKIKVGYSVDIEIVVNEAENVVSVPTKSLFYQDGNHYVYIIKDNELIKTQVTPGFFGDKAVEITSGLNVYDQVILNPEDVK